MRDGAATSAATPDFGNPAWRAGNALADLFARLGMGPIHVLTTRGRRTGRLHATPVVPIEHDGSTWLVAPYGRVSWVDNARAAGRVTLRHGRATRWYAVREASAEEAGPVLKRYVAIAGRTRACFSATADSPVEDFVAEAGRHPVFELTPTDG